MSLRCLDQYEYVSFDVFDTLLTRSYLKPAHLFLDLEQKLVSRDPVFHHFAEIRVQSELDVRRRNNFQVETSLDEIYEEIGRKLGFSQETLEKVLLEELALERKSLVVNSRALILVRRLRDLGKKVLYITDTYFSKLFVREILLDNGVMQEGEPLYVSSSTMKMKSNGEMFDYVLNDLQIQPGQLCHLGDNLKSDVENPRMKGLASVHYQEVFNSRYENYTGDDLLMSRMVSISKATRLQREFNNSHRQTIWDVTAGVAAPLIFFFVYWTLCQAMKKNIKNIYYLSRDGQIMHKIASKMIDIHFKGQLQCHYLYVSRQALLFPAMTALNEEALEWIMAPTSLLTPHIILKRINVQPEELSSLLKKFNFYNSLDMHMSGVERSRFADLLGEAESFILSRAEVYRGRAREYFVQEGLFADKTFAIVDIGWSGTLQRSISRILDMFGKKDPVHGFYFGLRTRKKHKQIDTLSAWFTDENNRRGLDKKTFIIPMTEIFSAADHGGVKKYRIQNDVAAPVLMNDVNDQGLKWGVDVQQESIVAYAEHALKLEREQLIQIACGHLAWFELVYERFLLTPTYDEAKVYGAYEIAEDQNESYSLPLATKYSLKDLMKIWKRKYRHHHNEWREGAMRLTVENVKKFFSVVDKSRDDEGTLH